MKRINIRLAAALAGVMLAAGSFTTAISADWQEKGGNTYYQEENGEYSKGWKNIDGKDYYFKTTDEFRNLIDYNGFIEWAQYVDNYYGTPRKFVEEEMAKGNDVILEIERTLFEYAVLGFNCDIR